MSKYGPRIVGGRTIQVRRKGAIMADKIQRGIEHDSFDDDLLDDEDGMSPEYAAAYAWLAERGDELAVYPGEWVAWSNGQVIAHNRSLSVVQDAIDALGIESVFLIPVPTAEALSA
jgi:hypothetical protein